MNEIAQAARIHADNLSADIQNAATRTEHIRLSRLAEEAERVAHLAELYAADADAIAHHIYLMRHKTDPTTGLLDIVDFTD